MVKSIAFIHIVYVFASISHLYSITWRNERGIFQETNVDNIKKIRFSWSIHYLWLDSRAFMNTNFVKERSLHCLLLHSVSFQILKLRWRCRDKGDSTADGAYAVAAHRWFLWQPPASRFFLKLLVLGSSRYPRSASGSVNLEFGSYASIYRHITLARSTHCKWWVVVQ